MAVDVYELFGVPSKGFNSTPFVTSWCLPTYLLATIRLLLSFYSFTTIIFSFKWFAGHTVIFHLQDIETKAITFPVGAEGIRQSFSYFTYLTFWGLAFYFLFASMHTFTYARRKYTWLDHWPSFLQTMHSVYYSTIVCFPFLVTTVFWGSMWTRTWWSDDFSQWNMVTMHAMNSVMAGFEIIVTQTNPLPIAHLMVLLLIMSMYLGVAYITKATEAIYIYLWLDPNNGLIKLFLHIIGYAALNIGFFFFVRFAISLRCRCVDNSRRRRHCSHASSISWGGSKRISSSNQHLSAQESRYWTYDRFEMERLREEKEKQLHSSVSEIRKPEPSWSRPETCRSFNSQATTVTPTSPSLPSGIYDRHEARRSHDCGWPLVAQTPPRSPLGFGGGPGGCPAYSPSVKEYPGPLI